jgi:hypothetical protein
MFMLIRDGAEYRGSHPTEAKSANSKRIRTDADTLPSSTSHLDYIIGVGAGLCNAGVET